MHLQISVHIWSPPLLLKKHEWEHTTHHIARHFFHPTMGLADHSTAPHKTVLVLSPARVCLTVFPADELLVSNSLFQMMLHLTVSERASCSLCLIAFAAWSPRGGDPGYEPLDFNICQTALQGVKPVFHVGCWLLCIYPSRRSVLSWSIWWVKTQGS